MPPGQNTGSPFLSAASLDPPPAAPEPRGARLPLRPRGALHSCSNSDTHCNCSPGRTRSIERVDTATKVVLEVFCSMGDLSRKLGLASSTASGMVKHHRSNHSWYLRYMYPDENEDRVEPVCIVDDAGLILQEFPSLSAAAEALGAGMDNACTKIHRACSHRKELNGMKMAWKRMVTYEWLDCAVCGGSDDSERMAKCCAPGCSVAAHPPCVGCATIPGGDWFCAQCAPRFPPPCLTLEELGRVGSFFTDARDNSRWRVEGLVIKQSIWFARLRSIGLEPAIRNVLMRVMEVTTHGTLWNHLLHQHVVKKGEKFYREGAVISQANNFAKWTVQWSNGTTTVESGKDLVIVLPTVLSLVAKHRAGDPEKNGKGEASRGDAATNTWLQVVTPVIDCLDLRVFLASLGLEEHASALEKEKFTLEEMLVATTTPSAKQWLCSNLEELGIPRHSVEFLCIAMSETQKRKVLSSHTPALPSATSTTGGGRKSPSEWAARGH
uniref:Zinc finger PHD-type domain-containing protein n=1 Tax=Rhizochromulina marina TaxID=1034831 RepID=A0A7S2SHD0_9STRA|mmetsp:Transcript_30257/g.88112  ORF Transcript_30257/g.88112 Transcript_30257/m.88112 type:complete len:495 (+) Transcript_30257:269-1753(+)